MPIAAVCSSLPVMDAAAVTDAAAAGVRRVDVGMAVVVGEAAVAGVGVAAAAVAVAVFGLDPSESVNRTKVCVCTGSLHSRCRLGWRRKAGGSAAK